MKKHISEWLQQSGRMLKNGTCEVKRADTMCDTENLAVVFQPTGSNYPVTVDFGDSELADFANGTPIKDVLKTPVETEFSFKGKLVNLVLRNSRSGKVKVELRETFTENVVSGVGVFKEPFATFIVHVK